MLSALILKIPSTWQIGVAQHKTMSTRCSLDRKVCWSSTSFFSLGCFTVYNNRRNRKEQLHHVQIYRTFPCSIVLTLSDWGKSRRAKCYTLLKRRLAMTPARGIFDSLRVSSSSTNKIDGRQTTEAQLHHKPSCLPACRESLASKVISSERYFHSCRKNIASTPPRRQIRLHCGRKKFS